jgi:hypothetical protein
MKRYLSLALLLVALVVITACRPQAGRGDTATAEPAATEELGICPPGGADCEDEGAGATTTAEATAVPTVEPTNQPAADKQTPDPSPTPAEPVADPLAIHDTDWVKGAKDPVVTLIEYGDYF